MADQLTVAGGGKTGSFSYDILWRDSFSALGDALRQIPDLRPGRICIVSDSNVAELYMAAVRRALEALSASVCEWVFPAGEESKTLATVTELYGFLIERHFDRHDLLIALGGGVTGDLTGFAAATYLRGIDFVQIPTSLLAQVDSSIGGKTGVDMAMYKNMVGSFHQPRLVYMNTRVLETLPDGQFASGMGEVIKTALLGDPALYAALQTETEKIRERDPDVMAGVIRACCAVKADIVAQDPTEKGVRALLNLGHTLGHAIEKCRNYELPHGQCVGLGLLAAARLSAKRGLIPADLAVQIRDLLQVYDLPVSAGDVSAQDLLLATKSDKKMADGQIRFILLRGIGQAYVDKTVTDDELLWAAASVLSRSQTDTQEHEDMTQADTKEHGDRSQADTQKHYDRTQNTAAAGK